MRAFFSLPKYTYVALLFIAGIYLFQGDRYFGYTSKNPKTPVNVTSDGTGYFAYLPQYVVYPEQKSFEFIKQIAKDYPGKNFDGTPGFQIKNGPFTNKFYVGTPLLQAPFYLTAHAVIKMSGQKADGYSRGYRFSIQLAALFWVIIGFIGLIQFQKALGLSDRTALLSVVFLAFGTNLNTYAVYVPSMSHVYSFALISLFLFFSTRWIASNGKRTFLLMSLLLGLIVITRPVNVMILLILPFLFENFQSFLDRARSLFTEYRTTLLFGFSIFFLTLSIQLFIHHDLTGVWSLNTYFGEGFDNWKHPQFLNVLFSSQKGLFLYAPILLLIFPGSYFLYKTKRSYFSFGWLFAVLSILYMISSWWDWEYGGGLGMRPLIEFLPILILPVAFLIDQLKKWSQLLLYGLSCCCVLQFQLFQYQFNKFILPYSHVTWSQLARIKWKTAPRFEYMYFYELDTIPNTLKLKQIGLTEFKGKWNTTGDLTCSVRSNKELSLYNIKVPLIGKLSGEVKLHSDNSNPTIYTDYFSNGIKVRSTVQPFGNQVDHLESWTPVALEFFAKNLEFDSISLRLETFDHTNDYRNLRVEWFILK